MSDRPLRAAGPAPVTPCELLGCQLLRREEGLLPGNLITPPTVFLFLGPAFHSGSDDSTHPQSLAPRAGICDEYMACVPSSQSQ